MKVGLLLSGGMGKGAYQIGALRALEKYISREDITCISAASIGCLNGYGYVTGNLEYVASTWMQLNSVSDSIMISDVLRGSYLKEVIGTLAAEYSMTDFYIPVLRLGHGNRKVNYINLSRMADREQRAQYMQASVALPVLGKMVWIDGNRYCDGGVVDNNPITPLLDADVDLIIAMYYDKSIRVFDDPRIQNKIIKICFDDGVRVKNEMYLTRKSVKAMMAYGESYTNKVLGLVIGKDKPDAETILSRLSDFESVNGEERNKKNVTIARGISVVNRLSKFFLR